jgi:hypothetical protein
MIPAIDIVLLEKDGDAFHFLVQVGSESLEVVTTLEMQGELLVARDLHIEGPGPGLISPRLLLAVARKRALSWGATAIMIYGGVRTTGASLGHRPRPLQIEANAEESSP